MKKHYLNKSVRIPSFQSFFKYNDYMNTQSEQLSGQSTAYIATNKDGSSFIYLHMPMRGKFIPKWFPIDTNFFPIDSDELRESIGEENIPSWKEEPKEIKITIIFKPVRE